MTSMLAALAAAIFVLTVLFAARWAEASQRLDTDMATMAWRPRCGIGGCGKPMVAYYTAAGSVPVCAEHSARIWRHDDTPYDQELAPGTDLHAWEGEVEG